jgi:hypothetical protein
MKITKEQWGNSPTNDYRAQKPMNIQPKIIDHLTDDEGVLWYILESGNQINAERHDAMWNMPKGKIITDPKWKGGTIVKSHIAKDTILKKK